jgi:glucose-6-phosphate isomerase
MKTMPPNSARATAWTALERHFAKTSGLHLRDLFAADPERASRFSLQVDDLFVDYSKHRITAETFTLLLALADAVGVRQRIHAMFSGAAINATENRAVLHTALRSPVNSPLVSGIETQVAEVHVELARMGQFVQQLHKGELLGSTGEPFTHVVNIGIGGSDLGPRLVVDALRNFQTDNIQVDFVANLDEQDLRHVLKNADPGSVLFIVTSKSFTTLETHANALAAREWLRANGCADTGKHFAAVSTNLKATGDFGIAPERVFRIWDWVGGRYSVWSVVGLPVAIHAGMDGFRQFLDGAHHMDRHFLETPPERNLPLILGMLDVWYNNFFGAETLAVVPYDERLRLLPAYLSQLVMESNGKGVDLENHPLDCKSSPIVWGSVGTNAQHAFFQLLHQGNRLIPVDFLVPWQGASGSGSHHKVVANCLAQGEALMLGRDNPAEPYRHFPGNRPSTAITYPDLTPAVLGMLLALYEHRTFVQAQVWGIDAFDQWGVELGKQLAGTIIREMEDGMPGDRHDSSTAMLMRHYLRQR